MVRESELRSVGFPYFVKESSEDELSGLLIFALDDGVVEVDCWISGV